MKTRKHFIILELILFVILSILVLTNLIVEFDSLMYNLITIKMNDTVTCIYNAITFLGSTAFIIFLCAFFLILFIILKKKNVGIIITVFLIISTIINNLLKIIFARGRPDVLQLVVEDSFSYPSGHTMASVSMYGMLIYIIYKSNINKKLKNTLMIFLGIIPILVAISRVYLGAHYFSDVLASFLVSTILLLISTYFIDKKNWL